MQTSLKYDESSNFVKVCENDFGSSSPDSTCSPSPRSESSSIDSSPNIRVYKERWLILMSYCLLSTSAGSSWLCFPAVSNILQKYYQIGVLPVNLLSIIFGVAIVLFSLPFAMILDRFGLGFTLKLAAFSNLVGALIRYFGVDQTQGYWFLLIGNAFTAISVAGFLFLPGKIALSWFSEKEMGKATSICIAFDALGTGLGFIHATLIIRNHPSILIIGEEIQLFLLSQLVPAAAIFLFVLVFTKSQPKLPPNVHEMQYLQKRDQYEQLLKTKKEHKYKAPDSNSSYHHLTLRRSLFALLKNKDFHLIVHMQGITASIEGIYEMLLNEMLIVLYPGTEQQIGIMGFVAVFLGFASNILIGTIMDKTGSYKKVSFCIFLLTTLCCIAWSVLMEYVRNFALKAFVFCLLMSTCTSYYTIAFVHSSIVTAPISPSATGVMLVLTSQVYDTVVSFVATEILETYGATAVNITTVVACLIATCLSLAIRGNKPATDERFV